MNAVIPRVRFLPCGIQHNITYCQLNFNTSTWQYPQPHYRLFQFFRCRVLLISYVLRRLAYPYPIFFYIRPKHRLLVFPIRQSVNDRMNHCINPPTKFPKWICIFIMVTFFYFRLVYEYQQIPIRPFVEIATSLRAKKDYMSVRYLESLSLLSP